MNAYLVVPATTAIDAVFDSDLLFHLRADRRSIYFGVAVLMPKDVTPGQIVAAAALWPSLLRREVGVTRLALILGIAAYTSAEPVLRECTRTSEIELAFFHEAQLETDAVSAWCEQRRPRRKRVTTDALMKLCARYMERNDVESANAAYKLAERAADDLDVLAEDITAV